MSEIERLERLRDGEQIPSSTGNSSALGKSVLSDRG